MSKGIFSIHSLVDWLKTKNPEEKYTFISNTNCALCQYFRAQGLNILDLDPGEIELKDGTMIPMPAEFNDLANPKGLYAPLKHNFGDMMIRAEYFALTGKNPWSYKEAFAEL